MTLPRPVPLGLKKSFGFGDRLGLATPGHLASARKFDFAPIFAQQSIREMERTHRTPEEVMSAAQSALTAANYTGPWGADGDHLKTQADVQRVASAGFCFFTIDPSAFVENHADKISEVELDENVEALDDDDIFEDAAWMGEYLDRDFNVGEKLSLRFDETSLKRAAVKYARAIDHTAKIAGHIRAASGDKPFEIEVSVDETDSPTSALEHLFFGLELKRRDVTVVSLAPRFIGDFEKGIDYRGDLKQFEASLHEHVAIAKFCGPYKISIHSGSDKFSAYPIIGRVCGDLLHVKTAGTSYLEALRVVARRDSALFAEITHYCVNRFATDRKSYHISTTENEIAALAKNPPANMEKAYLDERVGRQLLHVTFGSVLTIGHDARGLSFRESILELLEKEKSLHSDFLISHFDKHLRLLNQG